MVQVAKYFQMWWSACILANQYQELPVVVMLFVWSKWKEDFSYQTSFLNVGSIKLAKLFQRRFFFIYRPILKVIVCGSHVFCPIKMKPPTCHMSLTCKSNYHTIFFVKVTSSVLPKKASIFIRLEWCKFGSH